MVTPLIIFDIMAVAASIIFAVAITMLIVANALNRSNNLGDTSGGFKDYSTPIRTSLTLTDVPSEKASHFVTLYGENPFENDNSKAPEILKANEEEDIYGDLPDVDIPLFKPLEKPE